MLDESLRSELEGYMLADEFLLGEIFTLYKEGVTDAKQARELIDEQKFFGNQYLA